MGAISRMADALEDIARSLKWRNQYLERMETHRRHRNEYQSALMRRERGLESTGDQQIIEDFEGGEEVPVVRNTRNRPMRTERPPRRPVERSDVREGSGGPIGRERSNETGGSGIPESERGRAERAADGAEKSGWDPDAPGMAPRRDLAMAEDPRIHASRRSEAARRHMMRGDVGRGDGGDYGPMS